MNPFAAYSTLRLPTVDRSTYFFRGTDTCRLCQQVADPLTHFSEGVEARYHVLREMIASSLLLHHRAGVDPADVVRSWPDQLLKHRAFPRIDRLIKPSLLERAEALHSQLTLYRDLGFFDAALSPAARTDQIPAAFAKKARNRVAFERHEFVGDAMWGSETSKRIAVLFPRSPWLSEASWAFGILRDNIESNVNQMQLFDCLKVKSLLPNDVLLSGDKPQADIIEAIGGAMYDALWSFRRSPPSVCAGRGAAGPHATIVSLLEHSLSEFVDLTVLAFLFALAPSVLPIVRERQLSTVWADGAASSIRSEKAPKMHRRSRFSFQLLRLETHSSPAPPPKLVMTDIDQLQHRLSGRVSNQNRFPFLASSPSPRPRIAALEKSALLQLARDALLPTMSDIEVMKLRMHPLNTPFVCNSGAVPAIVQTAAAVKLSGLGGRKLKPNRILRKRS